jgi:uncharacterized damage-inducible protein DinB
MMNELLLRLIGHMRWADALAASALRAGADTNADTESEREARRVFAHIASVEHLWFSRIHGRAAAHAVWPELSVDDAAALAARHADLFEHLVAESDDAQLGRRVSYRNSAGLDFQSSVADIVTHTSMHGEHHRGQIARLIRAAGREPPYTDFIQFVRA